MTSQDNSKNGQSEMTDVDVKQSQNLIGAVPEEQAMNGLYGMVVSEAEEQANNHNEKG